MRSEFPLTDQLDRHHTTLDPDAPIADDLPIDLVEELRRIEEKAGGDD